jgi:hypothetical protein
VVKLSNLNIKIPKHIEISDEDIDEIASLISDYLCFDMCKIEIIKEE